MFRTGSLKVLIALWVLLWGAAAMAQPANAGFKGPFGISGVLVEGNRKTKEKIILRELTFREGDTLSAADLYERLEQSRKNLLNLGLFNTVDLVPTFLGPHEVFISVGVNERWFWIPVPQVSFADPNFNTWWLTRDFSRLNYGAAVKGQNLRGRNETLAALAQLGYIKKFGLAYRVPYVDRSQRWGAQVEGAYGEQDETTIGTVGNKRVLLKTPAQAIMQRWKAGAGATFRRSLYIRHTLGITWNQVAVRDTVVARNPDYLAPGRGRVQYISLAYSATMDRRDSRAFPLQGTFAKLEFSKDGIGAGHPGVTNILATVQQSWRTGQRWSLGASVKGKLSRGTPKHYFLQEGIGYADYMRGYEYYIIDGQDFLLGKANILFALVTPRSYRAEGIPWEPFRTLNLAVYLNAFSDHGYVRDTVHGAQNFLANQWQHSYGLGLDVVTSYDFVLRLEWAVNRMDETGFYLHFTQPF